MTDLIREGGTKTTVRPLVFVTVGTDHHPFDRLIEWVERWQPVTATGAHLVYQVGPSRRPTVGRWQEYFTYEQMEDIIRTAAAVVCHGGPATILDCRRSGIVPIVLPRSPELGEHVDDHQVRFTSFMARQHQVHLVSSETELHNALENALLTPEAVELGEQQSVLSTTIERFEQLIEGLTSAGATTDGRSRGKGKRRQRVLGRGLRPR